MAKYIGLCTSFLLHIDVVVSVDSVGKLRLSKYSPVLGSS